ncbi:kinase, PfkB family [Gleimia coleocanis DSM 15436]|uniref:Kinase, PfkB family n=1 Tax=Gleimia coleocanis DSM 15436 TaxID=525245 RepID=C0W0D7_9ACTO|nr:kinase, PfkB family [Gleimia coleocanis DSM 15436]
MVLNLPTLIDALPTKGEMIKAESILSYPGGGFIGMAAAAELGVETCMLSVLGTGPNSYVARREILSRNIKILTDEVIGDIGLAISLVESDGHTTVIVSPGVEYEPDMEHYRQVELRAGDVVLAHGSCLANEPVAKAYLRWVSEIPAEVKVVVAPSPILNQVNPVYWQALLQRADYLTMNNREFNLLQQILADFYEGATFASLMRPESTVVVRRGDTGCEYWKHDGSASQWVDPFETQAVDTSGVGDTHVSVMCAVLAQGMELDYALKVANAAGACMVSHAHSFPPPSLDQMLYLLTGM